MTVNGDVARLSSLHVSRRGSVLATGLVVAIILVIVAFVWAQQRHSASHSSATVTGFLGTDSGPGASFHPSRFVAVLVAGETAAGTHLVRHLRTNGRGRFAVKLPPGRYRLTGLAFAASGLPLKAQPQATISVRRGHPVHVRIVGVM